MPSRRGAAVVLVGHVTKEGQIAGPRVVEHMVDLAFSSFRGARAGTTIQGFLAGGSKNRFGPTDRDRRLSRDVGNKVSCARSRKPLRTVPRRGRRDEGAGGRRSWTGMEGTRPVLVEISGRLAFAPVAAGDARAVAVIGWDGARLYRWWGWRCSRRIVGVRFGFPTMFYPQRGRRPTASRKSGRRSRGWQQHSVYISHRPFAPACRLRSIFRRNQPVGGLSGL